MLRYQAFRERDDENIIGATILNGKIEAEDILLPLIQLILTDMPFEFKLLQFPMRLTFAITIYNAQGQSPQVWTDFGKFMLLT